MHIILLSSILIGDRQRSEIKPEDQQSLMESILRNGLLHAIVVEPIVVLDGTEVEEADVAANYRLLAGERRFRAISALSEFGSPITFDGAAVPLGSIPVTFRSELSAAAREEIELEENIRRVDLSWQDRTRAIARLHSLREEANPAQTFGATRDELASMGQPMNPADVQRSITVARHLSNPKVAAARNMKEALNIIVKSAEADIRADLLQASEQTSEHELHIGSCIELLPALPTQYYDCILTDPPYGMGADDFGKHGPSHQYADDAETAGKIWDAIFREGFRLCKPDAHLYMFCDIDNFSFLRRLAIASDWKPFRTPLIWHKTAAMGHDPWPQRGFRRSYETILYAVKGDRPYQVAMTDVIPAPNISSPFHPAAKPAELFAALIRRSCIPGDRVLDPCCGIGPIFEAARMTKTIATGIEIDPEYAKVADNRRFEEPTE